MNKWVQNKIVKPGTGTTRASVVVVHGGGELVTVVVPSCIWVCVKNGEWIPRTLLEEIGVHFKGADVTFTKGAVLVTNDRFAYRFKTRPKSALTPTKGGKKNESK
jgi:hypothetical protein